MEDAAITRTMTFDEGFDRYPGLDRIH